MFNEVNEAITADDELIGMSAYIGTKLVTARPMRLTDYNMLKGWKTPDNMEDTDGYFIRYPDGYTSWCPDKQFIEAYRLVDGLSFGLALEAMKKGYKVARTGWNGKDMFCFLVPGSEFKVNRPPLLGIYPEGTTINYRPHIDMKDASGAIGTWLASQTDMLTDDWFIVE